MVAIIGAGPIGLATSIALKNRGIPSFLIDRGCLVNSIYNYPVNMTFFSTSDRLEIGNIPFISHGPKPTRKEALEYYRRAAEHYDLDVRLYESVDTVKGEDGDFTIITDKGSYSADKVVVATGFYGQENKMGVPGEDLEKVLHYYDEPHRYAWQNVLVVGGGNSAVDAALETYRSGADVSILVRNDSLKDSIKYWVKPDIENRIKEESIIGYFNSEVLEIREKEVDIKTPDGKKTLKNDFVLAMTGYRPHYGLMESLEIELTDDDVKMPVYREESLETNRPGMYVAGVVCGGMDTSRLFIENTRVHADQIAKDIEQKLG
ncbi:YpdA family putative bacillithiol disulfide reductase [Rhodohalobacter sp. SW132]|uniref:YpdA family putative bacillithiol disulfide reductase n=1 Tax=Rhodohalobacter sp. SW132 TaxID=2293433 RepID=UPI000E267C87|nr:YpdA family putative bacillithiol disulfide reductase [Rhodohalobacter sp. SW132]REL24574.1 YpdA family putative bacillithiol disulfide reductase [Rhodohalobacter sp. SW132]